MTLFPSPFRGPARLAVVPLLACLLAAGELPPVAAQAKPGASAPAIAGPDESSFLTGARQITFDGLRSGEGYFNADATRMVFQSERESGNPFYQIYLLDFETGETRRVSPGKGMTTCSWIHPDGKRVMFASTHDDPAAMQKQADLIKKREEGNAPRYEWNYDDQYQLYETDLESGSTRQLTSEKGYDAEGSYSPDGTLIAFASNRRGYEKPPEGKAAEIFSRDLSYMMDIYIMNSDGTNVRQLTDSPGYDGGPFFSADGKQICWRRFSEDGATAEIFTMNIDGSEQRQLTCSGTMSWAPFFHPSGKYLIYNTNTHGFGNFELYLVDAEGQREPVRVTTTDGFDGLASFTGDGQRLTWTSNRNEKRSQIFLADWNHAAALKALGLDQADAVAEPAPDDRALVDDSAASGRTAGDATDPDFRGLDLMKHVDFLCHPRLAGRMTGSSGERQATAYVAAYLDHLGLQPAGDNGTWYQEFEFPAGAELGPDNQLTVGAQALELDRDWRPLTFSQTGAIEAGDLVWAGYGIVAPEAEGQPGYDSYVHLDVTGKWVLALRYLPENITPERRQHLQYHSELRKKAMEARDRGARGIIFVSGPNSAAREQLVPLEKESPLGSTSVAVVSVTDTVAADWLKAAGKDLKTLQDQLDTGEPAMGIPLGGLNLSANIAVTQKKGRGRNVVGRLPAGRMPGFSSILVGAHIDHLGAGRSGSSLARDDEKEKIHFGADDNASGVAAMLEIAEFLSRQKTAGKLELKHDVVFAAWSGEELGLFGSQHYVNSLKAWMKAHTEAMAPANEPEASATISSAPPANPAAPPANPPAEDGIYPYIAACLNMDMVGRYNDSLMLQGVSSSPDWKAMAELGAMLDLNIKLIDDVNLPTDATSFYRAGVPILSAFTGSHTDYHTPRDTPDKLDYESAAKIARLMGLITRKLATGDAPRFVRQELVENSQPKISMIAYLGTLPNYAGGISGTLLDGVTEGAPAHRGGVRAGDVVVELAGKKIENVQEYSYALGALKPGQEVAIVVMRGDQRLEFKIIPERR